MLYIAFDPGKTTGIFEWSVDLKAPIINQLDEEELYQYLIDMTHIDLTLVVENYKIRPGVNHAWSEALPIQIKGSINLAAYERGIKPILQEPSIKPVGYSMAGLQYKAGKAGTHWQDAAAHLAFYLCTKEGHKIAPWRADIT